MMQYINLTTEYVITIFLGFTAKKTSDTSIKYVTIRHPGLSLQGKTDIQCFQEHSTSRHTMYATATKSVMFNDTVSKLSRSYSDSYLFSGSNTGFTELPADSTGENFFNPQIYSSPNSDALKFYSLPVIPQNVDYFPSADVLSSWVPWSDSSSYSSEDEYSQKQHLLPGDSETDCSSKYLTLKRGTNMPLLNRSHSLDADYFLLSYEAPPLPSLCADVTKQVKSGPFTYAESSHANGSELPPENKWHKRLSSSEVSHSDSSLNMLALNKEVYLFIANSLNSNGKEKCKTSLGEIFAKYCQKESMSQESSVGMLNKTTFKSDHTNEVASQEHLHKTPQTTESSRKQQKNEKMLNDNDDQIGED